VELVEVVLYVRDMGRAAGSPAERARLARQGVEVTEIREPVAGVQLLDARDPDGTRFSLEPRST
jgi:hypothetical protein